jgi:hypothetical protein
MVNYQLGKIYQIIDNTNNNIYIGSTCEPTLARRLSNHKKDYTKYLKNSEKYSYITSFLILKNKDYNIILIENCACNSKDELHARERYWTNRLECVNKVKKQGIIAEIGEKEYKIQYKEENKDKIKQYQKEYDKQYYFNNKVKINKRNKQYRENNKEKIKKFRKEKHVCQCGKKYTKPHKNRHLRSKKHLKWTKENEDTSDSSDNSDTSDSSDDSDSSDCSSDSDE